MALSPYLHFGGDARAAMEFYHTVFGGELQISTFGENGMSDDPALQDLVMHSQLEVEPGFLLMGGDLPEHLPEPGTGRVTVALSGDDGSALTGWRQGLTEGAEVHAPLSQTPWGDSYGSLTDRFGVPWMVNISG